MNFRKNSRGITLIALVITIIVLLILAGVSLSLVAGSNGIIGKASSAVDKTNHAQIAEEVELAMAELQTQYYEEKYVDKTTSATYADYAETKLTAGVDTTNGKITLSGTTVTYTPNAKGNAVTGTFNGETGEVKIAGATTGGSTPATPTYTAYSVGDEVTIGEESFYVIEASDENTEMVTLLAKYVLDASATKQTNADIDCVFSTNNYWSGETLPSSSPYFNLNDYPAVKNDTGSAVYKANKYATEELGAESGRLLTYEEANTLKDSFRDIIWVTYGNSKYYWLGSADDARCVWYVGNGSLGTYDFDYEGGYGVRPVIKISKSKI